MALRFVEWGRAARVPAAQDCRRALSGALFWAEGEMLGSSKGHLANGLRTLLLLKSSPDDWQHARLALAELAVFRYCEEVHQTNYFNSSFVRCHSSPRDAWVS